MFCKKEKFHLNFKPVNKMTGYTKLDHLEAMSGNTGRMILKADYNDSA